MLLASFGHDVGHPGVGNTYFVKSKNKKSLAVNGVSVLENEHYRIVDKVLKSTGLLDGGAKINPE